MYSFYSFLFAFNSINCDCYDTFDHSRNWMQRMAIISVNNVHCLHIHSSTRTLRVLMIATQCANSHFTAHEINFIEIYLINKKVCCGCLLAALNSYDDGLDDELSMTWQRVFKCKFIYLFISSSMKRWIIDEIHLHLPFILIRSRRIANSPCKMLMNAPL
jgi:hypothetical protein